MEKNFSIIERKRGDFFYELIEVWRKVYWDGVILELYRVFKNWKNNLFCKC